MPNFVDQAIANAINPINAVANSPAVRAAQAEGYQQGAATDVGLPGPQVAGPQDIARFIAQGAGQAQYLDDNRAGNYRTNAQRVGDMLNSAATGFFTTPVEMGNVPLSILSPTAGAAVNRFIQHSEENANSKKSDELHAEERAWQARNGITSDYHHNQQQADIASGDSELVAGLKRVGRDFISSVANSNADIIGDQVSDATGALLTAGPIEKGLAVAGKAALRAGMDAGVVASRGAARTLIRTGEKLAMPAIIGGQQSAGIDQSTAANILNMSPEELASKSQSYRDAINAGLSDEDARNLVARNAGLTAAAMSFPLAAAAGELRVPLARAPFAPGSAAEAIGNVLKSGVDGTIFGADGTLASNAATKMYANPDQELGEGLGDSIAQGGIAGLAMAGATQAPGLVGHAAIEAVKAPGKFIMERGASKQAKIDSRLTDLLNGRQQEVLQTIQQHPEYAQQLQEAIQNIQDPTERQVKSDYVEKIIKAATLQPEDTQSPYPVIQKALEGATDKFDAFKRIADVARDPKSSEEDKLSAGLALHNHFSRNRELLKSPGEALIPLPEDHPAVEHLRKLENVLADAEGHPDVQKAIKDASEFKMELAKLNAQTPEGKQNIDNAIGIAMHTPESEQDSAVPKKVLSLAANGDIKLSKEQRAALEVQAARLDAEQERQVQAKKLGLDPKTVSNEIQEKGDSRGFSLREHVANVVRAMNNGNVEAAKEHMANFTNFAQHMANKVEALNTHFETKNGNTQDKVPFEAYKVGQDESYTSHMYVKPTKKDSILLARHVDLDAQSVVTNHNLLAHAYPELGVKEIAQPKVNEQLTKGSVRDTLKTFKQRATEGKPQFERTEPAAAEKPTADQPVEKTDTPKAKSESAKPVQKTEPKGEVRESSAPKASEEPKVPEPKEEKAKESTPAEMQAELDAFRKRGLSDLSKEERARFNELRAKLNSRETEPVLEPVNDQKPSETEVKAETETAPSGSDPEATTSEEIPANTVGHPDEGTTSSVAERYPTLFSNVAKGVTNWFAKGFSSAKETKSRLVETNDPYQHVFEMLDSNEVQENIQEFTGTKLGRELSNPTNEAYKGLMKEGMKAYFHMKSRLEHYLGEKLSNGKTLQQTMLDGWDDKTAANVLKENKVLNLTEMGENGKLVYNEHLLQSALLAGLHWLVTSGQSGRVYDEESLAKMLNIETFAAGKYLSWFNGGNYTQDGVRSLTNMIERFWDVREKGNTPQGLNRGISEAMAKEVILGLKKAGLLKEGEQNSSKYRPGTLHVKENGKNYSQLKANLTEKMKDGIKAFPDLIEHIVHKEPKPLNHVGKAPTEVDRFQMGSDRKVKIKPQQVETIENHQATEHFLEKNTFGTVLAMGKEKFVKRFGYDLTDTDHMNINHLQSLQSYNMTVEAAWDYVTGIHAELQALAAENGKDIHEIPVHYEYKMSSVNRLHAQGRSNPQANKFVRMMILPTKAELSLHDPLHSTAFMMAVAQHMGLTKVENDGVTVSVNKVYDNILKHYPESFNIMKEWAAENGNKAPEFTDAQWDTILKEFGDGEKFTPEAYHALLDFSRAIVHDNEKPFQTSLYFESDGKTDGPGNSLMHFVSGNITPEWLESAAKMGFFVDANGPQTIADHVREGHGNFPSADMYGASSNRLVKYQTEALNSGEAPEVYDMRIHSGHLLNDLLGDDFNFEQIQDEIKLEIARNFTKNPMTVVGYGSGDAGIAAKIADEVARRFYKSISEGKNLDRSITALNALTSKVAIVPELKDAFVRDLKPEEVGKNNPIQANKTFTFTEHQLSALQENLKNMVVRDMRKAIEDTLPGTREARDTLRDAVAIQSIVAEAAIRQKTNELIAQKKAADPKWNQSIGLTQDEIDAIQHQVIKDYHLIHESPTQAIYPAGSAKADMIDSKSPVEISRGLGGELSTTHQIEAPGNAGVKGLPYSIISGGDGQMIQSASVGPKRIQRALPVFDGINVSLDRAWEDAENINHAVFKAWMSSDPLGNANRSYKGFLETIKTKGFPELSDRQLADLNKVVLKDHKNLNTDIPHLHEVMKVHAKQLEALARDNRAIKNVFEQQVQVHVDHMAGLEKPHISEGQNRQKVTGDFRQQSKTLNKLFAVEREKLTAKPEEEVAQEKEPTEDLSHELKGIGTYFHGPKLRVISKEELQAAKLKLRPEIQHLYDQAVGHFQGKIYIGEVEDLFNQLRREEAEGKTSVDPNWFQEARGNDIGGWFEHSTGDLYLTADKGRTGEVLTHELTHAATTKKAFDYAEQGGKNLSPSEMKAFDRLTALREQWMNLDPKHIQGEAEQKSYNYFMKIIKGHLDKGELGHAMSEFMAYAGTKENLIKIGKRVQADSKIAQLTAAAVRMIKKIVFGEKAATDKDLFNVLKSNIQIVAGPLADPRPVDTLRMGVSMHQSEAYGTDERLTRIHKGFTRAISSVAARASTENAKDMARKSADFAMAKAQMLGHTIIKEAFPMNRQQSDVFHSMIAAFMTETRLNGNSLARLHTLYSHVVKNLKVEDFMKHPDSREDPNDFNQAQAKLNAITGDLMTLTDKEKRSTLLPTFLALANVDEQFRDILSKMERPKVELSERGGLDKILEDLAIKGMDSLETLTAGDKVRQPHVQAAVDALTEALTERAVDTHNFITNFSAKVGNAFDKGNKWMVDALDKSSNWATDHLETFENKTDNRVLKTVAQIGQHITALASESRTKDLQEGLMEMVNRSDSFKTFSELLGEFVGRTDSNGKVVDLIKVAKTTVAQLRQKFRDGVPRILRAAFERNLSDEEKGHIHNALIRTDFMAVHNRYDRNTQLKLLRSEKSRETEIDKLESDLKELRPEVADQMIKKAKELADYMNTGSLENKGNFLRNAYAISHLFGERGERNANSTTEIVKLIDHLTSLYALHTADPKTLELMSELVEKESKGLQLSMDYLIGQRKDELNKANATDYSAVNHYKGHVHIENKDGEALIVADDREMARLIAMGYERKGDFVGSQADKTHSKGYYYAKASGRSPFFEGIMQNVQGTAYGVDLRTGFSSGPMTAGRIDDIQEVRRLNKLRLLNNNSKNPLMPIYDGDGRLVAFERSVDPEMAKSVKKPAEFDKAIGNWRGRQAEEAMAQSVNRKLIGALHEMWKKGQREERASFVNILDPAVQAKDPVLADAARLITPEARDAIRRTFGSNQFWVRRDLVNNAIGYRSASVTDLWTGETRISDPVRQAAVTALTGVFGEKAYNRLRWAEKFLQDTVSETKTTIIVRSVIVPMANTAADIFQLASRGVPPAAIAQGYVRKTTEINSYLRSEVRKQQIEAYLRGEQDPAKARALRAEAKSISDMQKNLSIWPLLKSGQFSVIKALAGEDESWKHLKSLDAMIERAVHKMPEPLQTAGRYGLVMRDSALFKAMERATEYSDFLGRAVLYDHLIKKGMESDKAIAQVSEEFVNYDYLPGRTRSYLESIGMTWFWNYKIRSAKVAMSILRNNPLHMMLAGLAPHPHVLGTIGNPARDNFVTMALDGRLKHSIGPLGMWEQAGHLNPWANIFGLWIPDV